MDLGLVIDKVTSISPISLTIALITIIASIAYYTFASKGLPPGPTGIPIFGYWPFLNDTTCHIKLDALKRKFGDVFCFTVLGRLYINLGTAKVIREAHITRGDCFGSRIKDFNLLTRVFEDGVAFSNGEPWKVLRKFFLQVLKERGIISVKDSMSGSMYDSINATIEHLRAKNGEPDNIVPLLTVKCSSILRQTLFGDSGVTEEQIQEINEYYGRVTECMTPTNLLMTGNIAKAIFAFMPKVRTGLQNLKQVEKILYKIIDDHKSSFDEEHIRDIIDEYLKERNLRRSKGDLTAQFFTDKALMASILQFMGDGVLSVAAFIGFFLKNLTDFPEEQEKIYEEIVEVVGLDRQPTIEDKNKLTYTNAFILEVLRTSDFFPLFPSQECIKETTLSGFRIPVGTVTLLNSWCVHYDPEVYEEPTKFDPSRYINKDGKKRAELPVTFGIGRRSCIGEGFTMMQVFLFLTTIVQNFRLTAIPTEKTAFELMFGGKMELMAHPRSQK